MRNIGSMKWNNDIWHLISSLKLKTILTPFPSDALQTFILIHCMRYKYEI